MAVPLWVLLVLSAKPATGGFSSAAFPYLRNQGWSRNTHGWSQALGWGWDGRGDLAAGGAGKVMWKAKSVSRIACASGGEKIHPKEPRVHHGEGKEGRQILQGSHSSAQCRLSGSYKYLFGFLQRLEGGFGVFLSWSRAGWAPGDISPRTVVLFLPGASQGEAEQGRGCWSREGDPGQPLLWAFIPCEFSHSENPF